tara:strand:+ start:13784 stop:15544 length:1761 start_codon:yes stop_codon:yes gene_type:complete
MSMFEHDDVISLLITEMFNRYNDTRYGIGSPYYKLLHTLKCVNKTFKENAKFGMEQSEMQKSNIYNKTVNNGAETFIYDRINGKKKFIKQYTPPTETIGLSRQYVTAVLLNRIFDSHPNILTMNGSLTYLNKNAIIYDLPVDSIFDTIKYSSIGPCPEIIIVHMMRSILSTIMTLHHHNITHHYVSVSTIYVTLHEHSKDKLPSFYLSQFDKSFILNNPHSTNDIVNVAEVALAFIHKDMNVISTYNTLINSGATFDEFYEHTCNVSVFTGNIKTSETKHVQRNRSLMRILYKMLCSRYTDTLTAFAIIVDLRVFDHPHLNIPPATSHMMMTYKTDFIGDPFIRHGFTTAPDNSGHSMWTYASEYIVKLAHCIDMSFHISAMQHAIQIMYNFMHTVEPLSLNNVPNLCKWNNKEESDGLLIRTIALACLALSSKINQLHSPFVYKACQTIVDIQPDDLCRMEGVILNNIDAYVYLHKLPITTVCDALKEYYLENNQRVWTRGSASLMKHVSTAVMVYTTNVDFSTTSVVIRELIDICKNITSTKKLLAPITYNALSVESKHPCVISMDHNTQYNSVRWLLTKLRDH